MEQGAIFQSARRVYSSARLLGCSSPGAHLFISICSPVTCAIYAYPFRIRTQTVRAERELDKSVFGRLCTTRGSQSFSPTVGYSVIQFVNYSVSHLVTLAPVTINRAYYCTVQYKYNKTIIPHNTASFYKYKYY